MQGPNGTPQQGLCPICGKHVELMDEAAGARGTVRLVGDCGDAFTVAQWMDEPEKDPEARTLAYGTGW